MKLPYAFSIRATRFPQLRLIVSDRPVLDHTRRIPAHSASMRSCRSARVGGTHCDGLFWSGAEYTAAVRKLFEAI